MSLVESEPREYLELAREEREARERLAAAREQALMDEGEAPSSDHALIARLEAEWRHALERLHLARGHSQD